MEKIKNSSGVKLMKLTVENTKLKEIVSALLIVGDGFVDVSKSLDKDMSKISSYIAEVKIYMERIK